MKKYITIAALLVAGSAFANAVSWEDGVEFTTDSFTTTGAWETTKGGASVVLLLNVEEFANLFDNATSSARPVFVSMSGADNNIVGLEAHEDGRITGASGVVAGGTYNNLYSFGADLADSISSINWEQVASAALTMALETSSKGTAWSLTVLNNDGTYANLTAGLDKLRWSSMGDITKIDVDKNVVQVAYAFDGFITGNDAYSLNRSAIPEPSAFGLLAGLGALALVGTRRRRK